MPGEKAAARLPPHQGPDAGTLVPSIQLMDASASVIVQLGCLGVLQVMQPAVVEQRGQLGVELPLRFGAVASMKCSRPSVPIRM